jgi:hypothetical protein
MYAIITLCRLLDAELRSFSIQHPVICNSFVQIALKGCAELCRLIGLIRKGGQPPGSWASSFTMRNGIGRVIINRGASQYTR